MSPRHPKRRCATIAILILAWAGGLPSVAHPQAAQPAAAASLDDALDVDTLPGDDFYAYANGTWLKATEIPAGRKVWGARGEIADRTRQQVANLLDDARAAPAGSDARKVADFRAAYMNEAALEARGIAVLKPLLARIDRIRDTAGLTHFLGSELPADVDPLNVGVFDSSHVLGLAVQAGNHGEKNHVAYLLQGGLGLDREQYLSADPRVQALRTEYQAAIGATLARLGAASSGAASTASRAAAVLALETALARSHADREASANEHNSDTLWTRGDFAREAPGLDWNAFFAAAGLAKQKTFVAWQPTALKGVAALVSTQPLQAWKDYLRIRVIARHAEVLPRAFAVDAMALRGAAAGAEQAGARAQRAIDATQAALGDALGRMYAERYFPPAYKARLQTIVANVVAAFTQRVEAAAWLSPASKATARAKLRRLYFGVGYPDKWQDYSDLVIDPADAVGNLQRVAQRNTKHAIARLGKPVDHTEWCVVPQWPGAMLTFHQNAYNFAAALLQVPKFDPAASDAAHYGSIGAIVGHEVSHFVDTLGADYAVDGSLRRWWTADDLARYEAATEPLVRQFSSYRPLPDVAVDGKLALTENVADLGGLLAAFDAYRRSLGSAANDQESVRRQDREFFIAFARAWRAKYRDDALKAQAASDHAPENFRVATVRNVDAWYDAFNVQPGQRLYLEPRARVRIW